MNKNKNLRIGDSFTLEKTITFEMAKNFADLSGDYNPVHMDEQYCIRHGLKSRVVHGMLVLSFLSAVLGMHLPGEGTLWLSQNIDFLTPARINDTLKITATILENEINNSLGLNILELKINIQTQKNITIARGRVKVCVK